MFISNIIKNISIVTIYGSRIGGSGMRVTRSEAHALAAVHNVAETMGVAGILGEDVLLRTTGLGITAATGRFTGRLDQVELPELFALISSGRIGDEPFISFGDLCRFVNVLLAAFSFPAENLPAAIVQSLLEPVKIPAIRLSQFVYVFSQFPFLSSPLIVLYERLLNPVYLELKTSPEDAVLWAAVGPMKRTGLFRATEDGFSMRALEIKAQEWPGDALLFVVHGTQLLFALLVNEEGTVLVELSPSVRVKREVDVNVTYAQGIQAGPLRLDDQLLEGYLNETRFQVRDVEIYGLAQVPLNELQRIND